MRVVFLGPPGAGKGTQAQKLAAEKQVAHISTGDIFRAEMQSGSDLGNRVKSFVERGELVPDQLVVEVVMKRLEQDDCKNGYILDGFPRTIVQAKELEKALAARGEKLDAVLYFDVPTDVVIERISGRLLCRNCGAGYHVKYAPPAHDMRCDKCGGELYQREDDKPEKVRTRLEEYKQLTADLIDYYERQGILKRIPAEKSIDEVWKAVLDAVAGL